MIFKWVKLEIRYWYKSFYGKVCLGVILSFALFVILGILEMLFNFHFERNEMNSRINNIYVITGAALAVIGFIIPALREGTTIIYKLITSYTPIVKLFSFLFTTLILINFIVLFDIFLGKLLVHGILVGIVLFVAYTFIEIIQIMNFENRGKKLLNYIHLLNELKENNKKIENHGNDLFREKLKPYLSKSGHMFTDNKISIELSDKKNINIDGVIKLLKKYNLNEVVISNFYQTYPEDELSFFLSQDISISVPQDIEEEVEKNIKKNVKTGKTRFKKYSQLLKQIVEIDINESLAESIRKKRNSEMKIWLEILKEHYE